MVRAVLFDWGETLVHFEWDDELLAQGHRAGLAALGRADEADAFTRRFREQLMPSLVAGDDYAALLRGELRVDPADLDRFLDAEYEAWTPAHALLGAAHALLDALRERGVATAIVANAWPEPARLARRRMAELGVAARVDAIVLSDEVDARKPAPEIFAAALGRLDVDASDALFVGDSLVADVQGAARVGMSTAQAVWFRADDDSGGIEPDFLALTAMDVLNIVRRLA